MIKAVLIDVDDTLLSFSGYVKRTMKEGFEHFGLAEYDDSMYLVFQKINTVLWHQIEQGTLTFEELLKIRWNRIFRELNIDFDGEVFEKYFREKLYDSAILEPGAIDLLEYLSKKYILCAASNGPFNQQVNRLKVGKLYPYFHDLFISEKVGAQKPSKEFFDHCIRCIQEKSETDILPEEIMMIGDSATADIVGGKQYGLKTCFYTGNKESAQTIAEADHTVHSLLEIKQIL